MNSFRPESYGPVLEPLLAVDRTRPLDAGRGNREARGQLETLTLERAFGHVAVSDRSQGKACISGVWLLHDFLEESHRISQELSSSEGSFWHGIMHRREGDYSNAKYWFRRVGDHAIFGELLEISQQLAESAGDTQAGRLSELKTWDPYLMVDLCESARSAPESVVGYLQRVQQAEWELLFAYCYREAVG